MSDITAALVLGFLFGLVVGVSLCAFLAFTRPIPEVTPPENVDKHIDLKI